MLPNLADDDGLNDLLLGIAAAPLGPQPDGWLALVEQGGHEADRQALIRLMGALRERPTPPPPAPAERLRLLRRELNRRRLAGYLIPRADEHQGEYVAARAERLRWLTGFSGSAGLAVVLREIAAVFVDGRYTVQAAAEIDSGMYELQHTTKVPVEEWVTKHLPRGGRLGYDPWLHTSSQIAKLDRACRDAGGRSSAVDDNLIDAIWPDQPPPPIQPVVVHGLRYAGRTVGEKREQIAEVLRDKRQDATVLTAPDAIAWLLNIRGADLPFVPLALAFAIAHADGKIELFIDPRKLTREVLAHLADGVSIAPTQTLAAALDRLGALKRTVRIDADRAPVWIERRLVRAGSRIVNSPDPCLLPKAAKNDVEQHGLRAAHVRDGLALSRFLAWLANAALVGDVTEMDAAARLEAFRQEDPLYRGASFATISAAGANGAIVHYRVEPRTNRHLEANSLYLVDSGGQYPDGTTDVTRTVAIGTPTRAMREHFTLVLKGHIAIATARFPTGTTGGQLDVLARRALWNVGLDYDHGTGHGVGAYASVHEGPQSISKIPNRTALETGMVISNEPGYYKTGAYGIRIENLMLVGQPETVPDGEHELFEFETLTLAPIDRSLVVPELLNADERVWLDAYHRRVRDVLTPMVDAETAKWLSMATAPFGAG